MQSGLILKQNKNIYILGFNFFMEVQNLDIQK